MCGIVFAGGVIGAADLDIFNQMLYCDVFRGVHSTGVMAKRLADIRPGIAKAVGPSAPFLNSAEYKELSEGPGKYLSPPGFLVGHNRHATKGAVTAENAHPFQHGNITLVHNGTLMDQELLPDHHKFVVDSENICYSIDKIGAAETIQKLDGAYTLIWHDNSNNTIHIIRNSERPFHLARCGQEWFGASEEDMLMWLLKRSKTHKSRINEHFECEVGVEYVFNMGDRVRQCVLSEQIKHTLPTFSYASRYMSYGSYNTYQSGSTTKNTPTVTTGRETAKKAERERQNALAVEEGVSARIDKRVQMIPHTFFPYTASATPDRGRITGYVYDNDQVYYEVDLHNASKQMYEDCMNNLDKQITGTVVSMSKVAGTLRVIINAASIIDTKIAAGKEPDVVEQDDKAPFATDSFYMPNGMKMTQQMWHKHDHNKCGGCNGTIPWHEAPKAEFAYNMFWHKACLAQVENAMDDSANGNQQEDTFQCAVCGQEHHMSKLDSIMSLNHNEDVCEPCANAIRIRRADSAALSEKKVFCRVFDKQSMKWLTIGFTEHEMDQMIRMRGSKKCPFNKLALAYIEKRSSSVYAYHYNPDNPYSPENEENVLKAQGGEAAPAATFSQPTSTDTTPLRKELRNGQSTLSGITKAYWTQIGQCCNCYDQIPWKDVEKCTLTLNNRVVCPSCRGE